MLSEGTLASSRVESMALAGLAFLPFPLPCSKLLNYISEASHQDLYNIPTEIGMKNILS